MVSGVTEDDEVIVQPLELGNLDPLILDCCRPVALGVAIGLAASAGLSRLIKHLLFNLSVADPLTWATVSFVLVLVAAAACYVTSPPRGVG